MNSIVWKKTPLAEQWFNYSQHSKRQLDVGRKFRRRAAPFGSFYLENKKKKKKEKMGGRRGEKRGDKRNENRKGARSQFHRPWETFPPPPYVVVFYSTRFN